jgi:sec-independent protein translocase protein TatA
MFGKIGIWQLSIIFGVFIALFGYRKLPEIGKTLGQGLRNFRRSMHEADAIDITPPAEKKAEEKEGNGE